MKFYLPFFLIFFFSVTSQANIDSLQQIAAKQTGELKLKTLEEIAKKKVLSPELLAAATELAEEARIQKFDLYLAKAYYYRLFHATQSLEERLPYNTLVIYANEAIEAYTKAKSPDGKVKVEMLLNGYLIGIGNYELALYHTQSFLNTASNDLEEATAYEMFGAVYRYLFQGKESIEALLKGISICERNANDPAFLLVNHSLYQTLYQSYGLVEDYDAGLRAVETSISIIKNMPNKFWIDNGKSALFAANIDKMHFYLDQKQYEKAGKLLEELDLNRKDAAFEGNIAALNIGCGVYYLDTKQYDKALDYATKATTYYTQDEDATNIYIALGLEAQILDSLHNYKQASLLKGKAIELSDSINREQATRSLSQMQTIYQVERLEAEKEQGLLRLERTYIIGVALSLICILLTVILLISKRSLRIQKEKNKKLFEQYKHLPLAAKTVGDAVKVSPESIDKKILYDNLVDYLSATDDYTNIDLSREELALKVNTNRQYLIEAIQENSSMTYGEFIMNFRLEHARKILLKNDNLAIKEVAELSGFSNKSTFYKHFSQKYGMTPLEFKSFVNEESKAKNVSADVASDDKDC